MMTDRHPAWDSIEPEASPGPSDLIPGQHAIELSKAISLKRIADALAGIDSDLRLVEAVLKNIGQS